MSGLPVRGFIIIILCTLSGVGLGFLVGLLMASTAPDFGLAILGYAREAQRPPLDGRQINIGLGIANGVWVGLIAGVALVIAEAIKVRKAPES